MYREVEMSDPIATLAVELDDGDFTLSHFFETEEGEDGVVEELDFELNCGGCTSRMTVGIFSEKDRKALVRGLLRMARSLKSKEGTHKEEEEDEEVDEEEE